MSVKEIAKELMKAIQPKLNDMNKEIAELKKQIKLIEGKVQTLNSVLMNLRKHKKK